MPKASIRDKGLREAHPRRLFFARRLRQNPLHHWFSLDSSGNAMKSIFLALALISTVAHATEDTEQNPCDAVENDVQTLACSAYGKTAAEQLLSENLQSLNERLQTRYGSDKAQLNDITAKIKAAQQLWQKQRDADCAIAAFPAKPGSEAYKIAENDCMAQVSDDRSEFLESIGQE
ncbi:Lysozyme inhibitor LprI N-terminal domain-containing protein [Pseudomonas mediterranea]